MERIVIYGKGGIGKSTVAANLSAIYGALGKKTLHVGCDPKHDSVRLLVGQAKVKTVLAELFRSPTPVIPPAQFVMPGLYGIDCVEAGGPEPGVGCGGRGVARMFELFDDLDFVAQGGYEVTLFDVLGDVVCGGFAAPLRSGYAQKIVIVSSEEMMSLYAANNICRAIKRHESNGIFLAGIVANIRDSLDDASEVEAFARAIGTRVLAVLPRDPLLRRAELLRRPLIDLAPEAESTRRFRKLADDLLELSARSCASPTPFDEDAFERYINKELA